MKVFAIIFLYCILFFGCYDHRSDFIPLKKNSGIYRIVNHGNGVLAKENQYILYSLLFIDNKGKVFLDKRQREQLLKEQVKKDSFSMQNISPVSELLQILSKGDSAILKIPLDEDEKVKDLTDSDSLIFYIKIFDILNEDQVLKYLSSQFKDNYEQNTKSSKTYNETRALLTKSLVSISSGAWKNRKKKTPNGIEYYILKNGIGGNVVRGQKAKFDFIGMTDINQKEFDNSYLKVDDVEAIAGNKVEIAGWDEALSVMNENMIAVFFIPSEMGYGQKGKGVVPPDSDLIYLIQLNSILK
jgi:FKBP-type peptidyl-prolyl cis-trans isomerase